VRSSQSTFSREWIRSYLRAINQTLLPPFQGILLIFRVDDSKTFLDQSISHPECPFFPVRRRVLFSGSSIAEASVGLITCCDLNEIRGNESLYCFEASGSVLGCEDRSRALCLCSACMRLLEHESSSTCLIFNSLLPSKFFPRH